MIMLSYKCSINTNAAIMAMEIAIRVLLFVAFIISEDLDPFQRIIQPEEMWLYKNPHAQHSTVSTKMLFAVVVLVPLFVILTFSLFRKDQLDFTQAVLACSLTELLNCVITNSIKLVIGSRCFPDGVVTANLVCTGDADVIKEGRKSFPSGHSSLAFSGFGFVALYLAGKLHTFESHGRGVGWKIVLTLLPLYVALMVALSRTADYRHHYEDVACGSVLGLVVAIVVYHQYYPPLTHLQCDESCAVLYPRKGSSLPEYTGLDIPSSQSDLIKMV